MGTTAPRGCAAWAPRTPGQRAEGRLAVEPRRPVRARDGPGGSTCARRRISRATARRSCAVWSASSAESSSSSTARIRAASRTYCETLIPCASAVRAIVVYARSANRIVVAWRAIGATLVRVEVFTRDSHSAVASPRSRWWKHHRLTQRAAGGSAPKGGGFYVGFVGPFGSESYAARRRLAAVDARCRRRRDRAS